MELPRITLDGREWYVDFRLNELRRVDNPNERIDLTEWQCLLASKQIEKTGADTL